MMHSFPNVRIGLLVGIGGGAPTLPTHDIRLGDIVKPTAGRLGYGRPQPGADSLFKAGVSHDLRGCTAFCAKDPSNLVVRRERTTNEDNPAIHYGVIASANQLMKDALIRDKLAAEKMFYSHKNKDWQGYAAMAAAACAKDLLCRIPPNKIELETSVRDLLPGVLGFISREEKFHILNWLTPVDYGPQQSDCIRRL
ncbi:hypothetical protein B0T24DRAFT_599725 [Lasiosphaeria ovina]|uniref:Nucleoside phosphorylase domain-containing protein n=1 Tax=Lasiosphaeria ovina TaxID=92902 RepID=A0AAE0MYF8_9PEZI|nr:hypothetical protein B0T24DRAFT_599725 [Lasiosphaeria ovina]